MKERVSDRESEREREREDRRLRIRKTHRCTEKSHPSPKPKSESLDPKNPPPKSVPSFNILKKSDFEKSRKVCVRQGGSTRAGNQDLIHVFQCQRQNMCST